MKVYRVAKLQMSTKKMADFMYAVIMHKASITDTYTIGAYKYSRKQNAYNGANIMISIEEESISAFEFMTGLKLNEQPKLTINNHD